MAPTAAAEIPVEITSKAAPLTYLWPVFLRRAHETKQQMDLGWLGVGFVPVDPAKPCIVRSRALQLFPDGQGSHVLSYYTSTSVRSD